MSEKMKELLTKLENVLDKKCKDCDEEIKCENCCLYEEVDGFIFCIENDY